MPAGNNSNVQYNRTMIRLSAAQWLSIGAALVLMASGGSVRSGFWYERAQPLPIDLPLMPVVMAQRGVDDGDAAAALFSSITAPAFYALSLENGQVLLERNADLTIAPASTTKLLTALVARENYSLSEEVTVPAVPFADPRQPLLTGRSYPVATLLAALLVSSNNTAAYALASHYSNGYTAYISEMNTLARQLGLQSTSFTNPAGFDDSSHLSTARDLAVLFRAAMRDQELFKLLSAPQHISPAPSDAAASASSGIRFVNTNALLATDQRVLAGKTGTTDEARQVLITLVETRGHRYVLVVLGSEDRYSDTRRLADWVDQQYTWQVIDPELFVNKKE